jgi:hypothetical protein
MGASLIELPSRWTQLRPHVAGEAYSNSTFRFNTVAAGRRSGKTERAKRKIVMKLLGATTQWEPRFFAGAPTRDQAKRIFWDDLKALVPKALLAERPSESDLCIRVITGGEVWVVGLDKPERIEGSPWDGGVITEFGNVKDGAWQQNIRPALSDRNGWCDLEGVPEGRNHYYELDRRAKALMKERGAESEWGSFGWPSKDILSPTEIAAAKEDLDELTFKQEYEASFINFSGRAYYVFEEEIHCAPLFKLYNPRAPLNFCFDFNVEPGVAAVTQEMKLPNGSDGTGVIGEVHIPRNSNTPAVCRRLVKDWGTHQGQVRCYGDATGGARGSAKIEGSDWELIAKELRPVFGQRLDVRIKSHNPKERARINSVNSRLRTASGIVKMMVDAHKAPNVVKDLEGVTLLEGGSGEIDKKIAPMLTHVSDAIGYYIEYEYPVAERDVQRIHLGGI